MPHLHLCEETAFQRSAAGFRERLASGIIVKNAVIRLIACPDSAAFVDFLQQFGVILPAQTNSVTYFP